MNIYERDKLRWRLLTEMYFITEASDRTPVDFLQLARGLGIKHSETYKASDYLMNDGLINPSGAGLSCTISHNGIKRVESFMRKIDFNETKTFDTTELFQLRIILDEIKQQIASLALGQEIIFDEIEQSFERSKIELKSDWKTSLEKQLTDWLSQKVINESASLIFKGMLLGFKVI